MKSIILSEAQIKRLFLLRESQESKSIEQAKKLLINKLGYSKEKADNFVRVTLRNDLPSLRSPEGGKFILGATRMFINKEFTDANILGNLNRTLKYVASDAHINEYDKNLNGLSAEELIQRFASNVEEDLENDKNEVNKMQFNDSSDYQIIQINSFEEANQYAEYTDWCVTYSKQMFDSYTSNGFNQFYFCLKNGFENVPKEVGENCPLDEYGLSMIAVSVDEEGALNTCTCRWNHDNRGNDNVMDTKQLSQVIGKNFYQTFKPNNKWEQMVEDKLQELRNGMSPSDVYEKTNQQYGDYLQVSLNLKTNLVNLKTFTYISDKWYDDIKGPMSQGWFKTVEFLNTWQTNLINEKGELLFPNQYLNVIPSDITFFNDYGLAAIKYMGGYNIINTEGKPLLPEWLDYVYCDKRSNLWRIEKNTKRNLLDQKGNIILPWWFYECETNMDGGYDFVQGFSGRLYLADMKGNFYQTRTKEPISLEEMMKLEPSGNPPF